MSSCEQDSIEVSSASIFESVIPEDGIIKEAEKTLGVLVKEERIFTDPISGSEFKMIFAAKSNDLLRGFFEQNTIELKGVSAQEKVELLGIG